MNEATLLGDRIAVFRVGGELMQYTDPATMLARPADPFVADLLGAERGLKLQSSSSAAQVSHSLVPAARPGEPVATAEWIVLVVDAGRPLG